MSSFLFYPTAFDPFLSYRLHNLQIRFMVDHSDKKRKWGDHGAKRRKHDRNKFRRIANNNPQKKDLTAGLSGILISCTPRHERDAFRDAVLLFGRLLEDTTSILALPTDPAPGTAFATVVDPVAGPVSEEDSVLKAASNSDAVGDNDSATKVQVKENETSSGKKQNDREQAESLLCPEGPVESHSGETTALDEVDAELKELRNPQSRPFSKVDGGLQGAVFMRVHVPGVDLERLVETALREARVTGSAGARRCFRVIPVHTTCYAKLEDVTQAAISVVQKHFPPAILEDRDGIDADFKLSNDKKEKETTTYAIIFRSRSNSGAHRDQYIPAIASAIERENSQYKVNLTNPDVTLLVEIVKTICYIGTFRHYFQLAKMNLQEAACPSKPNVAKQDSALSNGHDKKLEITEGGEAKDPEGVDTVVVTKSRNQTCGDLHLSEKTGVESSAKIQDDSSVVADSQAETTTIEKVVKEAAVKSVGPTGSEVPTGDKPKVKTEQSDAGDNAVAVEDTEN